MDQARTSRMAELKNKTKKKSQQDEKYKWDKIRLKILQDYVFKYENKTESK